MWYQKKRELADVRAKRQQIHQRYDRLIAAHMALEKGQDLSSEVRLKHFRVITEALHDWGTAIFADESYQWYQNFKEHHILPFEGAWVDQPYYVQDDFNFWRMLEQWHRINESLPSMEGVPTIEQFLDHVAPQAETVEDSELPELIDQTEYVEW